jgi:preprotein translocase subunit SecA
MNTNSAALAPNLDPHPTGVGRRQQRALVRLRRDAERHLAELTQLSVEELPARARSAAEAGDLAAGLAVAALAAEHTLGLTVRPNQLLTATALTQGFLVELATGEGKTLAATLAAAWMALSGEGVHVVTANEYLARRDAAWMAPVYGALGLSVAAVTETQTATERRAAYAADVTYATVSRIGFDHLFDHLATSTDQLVHRGLSAALVDEVDAVLIDEGRTPLVISSGTAPAEDLSTFSFVARNLRVPAEVEVDLSTFTVALTGAGAERAEELLDAPDLWERPQLAARLQAALMAEHLYRRDRDYVVRDGEVLLVDENTGRTMTGRRLVEGVHDALEAKEGVTVNAAAPSQASISVWALLRSYEHLCGLSGTVASDAAELQRHYGAPTVVVPSHLPSGRVDEPDALYATAAERDRALASMVTEAATAGRPVLVGTPSVDDAEHIAAVLRSAGLSPAVLTARDHTGEAAILAQAGRPGAVTVATNMAGRGVDIRLGGYAAALACTAAGLDPALAEQVEHIDDSNLIEQVAAWEAVCAVERAQVLAAGGLMVLGTSRHSSVRIDDQLRGRCGRNGEPGASRFLVSLEDDLVAVFSRGAAGLLLSQLTADRGGTARDKLIARTVAAAQAAVETSHREARRQLLEYEEVVDQHRQTHYQWRSALLQATLEELVTDAAQVGGVDASTELSELASRIGGAPRELIADTVRAAVCHIADSEWAAFLADLSAVERATALRRTANLTPLVEYRRETARLFAQMRRSVAERTLAALATVRVTEHAQPAA